MVLHSQEPVYLIFRLYRPPSAFYHECMATGARTSTTARLSRSGASDAVPPHAFFLTSAVFHYLGPSFAVLLFNHIAVLGVAWLRIATAAAAFSLWRRPWRTLVAGSWRDRRTLLALGVVLGVMNCCFYIAISRLPLATVGTIEFLGSVMLAAVGVRSPRNRP